MGVTAIFGCRVDNCVSYLWMNDWRHFEYLDCSAMIINNDVGVAKNKICVKCVQRRLFEYWRVKYFERLFFQLNFGARRWRPES